MRVKHDYARMALVSEFAAVIKRERASRGMGPAAFARLIGVSRPSLDAYEKKGQLPKLEQAAEIAQRLGITLDQLAGAAPPPGRSLELAETALGLAKLATAQAAIANELQATAALLSRHGGQADDAQAGTG